MNIVNYNIHNYNNIGITIGLYKIVMLYFKGY